MPVPRDFDAGHRLSAAEMNMILGVCRKVSRLRVEPPLELIDTPGGLCIRGGGGGVPLFRGIVREDSGAWQRGEINFGSWVQVELLRFKPDPSAPPVGAGAHQYERTGNYVRVWDFGMIPSVASPIPPKTLILFAEFDGIYQYVDHDCDLEAVTI